MSKFLCILLLVFSCSGGDNGGSDPSGGGGTNPPSNIIPTNLTFNVEIVGSDSSNPNGDGKGVVKFSASATNAVNYSFRFGNGESKNSSNGAVEYTYSDVGTKS